MSFAPSPLRQPVVAPEVVRRLGLILAGLAAVVARRFLREPKLVALIVPLWGWLGRSVRRFERLVTRPVVVRSARSGRAGGTRAIGSRLPSRRGWLVRALGWEAAGYGCQLEALMAEPEMVAVLEAVPAVGRILRPLCRMLGVAGVVAPVVVRPVVGVTAEVNEAKPARKVPAAPRPGLWRPGVPANVPAGAWFAPPVAKRG